MVQVLLEGKGAEIRKLEKESGASRVDLDKDACMICIRGDDEQTGKAKDILNALEELNQADTIAIDPDDTSLIVGVKGATINRIQADFGVKLNVSKSDGEATLVKLRGTAENVAKAKAELDGIINGGTDGKTKILDGIEDEGLGALIGPKGSTIKKFQSEHEVKVDLLRERHAVRVRGEDPEKVTACIAAMNATLAAIRITTTVQVKKEMAGSPTLALCKEVGGELEVDISYKEDSSEGHPIIMLRGGAAAVNEARRRVTQLVTGRMTETMVIGKAHMPTIQGSDDDNLERIRESSSATIEIDALNGNVVITGNVNAVQKAKTGVESLLQFFFPKDFGKQSVPRGSAGYFIAGQRAQLKKVMALSGCSAATLDSTAGLIRLVGDDESIPKAQEAIKEIVEQWEKENIEINMGKGVVKIIIGKKGVVVNKLQSDSGAKIKVDGDSGVVRVSGTEEQVDAAKAAIEAVVEKFNKENKVIEVDPESVGSLIGKKGVTIRMLQDESGAKIDVDSDGGIVTVRGDEAQIQKAIDLIEARIADNKVVKIAAQGREFSAVIGKGGETVNKIRDESGVTSIDLDRDAEVIVLRGSTEANEKATAMIEEILAAERKNQEEWLAQRAKDDEEWEKKRAKEDSGEPKEGGKGPKTPKGEFEEDAPRVFTFAQGSAVVGGASLDGAGGAGADGKSKSAARRERKREQAELDGAAAAEVAEVQAAAAAEAYALQNMSRAQKKALNKASAAPAAAAAPAPAAKKTNFKTDPVFRAQSLEYFKRL